MPHLNLRPILTSLVGFLALSVFIGGGAYLSFIHYSPKVAAQSDSNWQEVYEWSQEVEATTVDPFSVKSPAQFTNQETGEVITTEWFFVGDNTFKLRFSGYNPGTWNVETTSPYPQLDNFSTIIYIPTAPSDQVLGAVSESQGQVLASTSRGFVTNLGNQWGWSNSKTVFTPQLAMAGNPGYYYRNPAKIDQDIERLIVQHGFNGLHIPVFCHWYNINSEKCSNVSGIPAPDPRTFQVLETIINKVYAKGGMVHLWMYGDNGRQENPNYLPTDKGLNGTADRKVQDMIASRLGPLPGWTMGYGYDVFEWAGSSQATAWSNYLHTKFGSNSHLLGVRGNKNGGLIASLDYDGYEQHRPNYDKYRQSLKSKPTFSEDRFRLRQSATYATKDYDEQMTRRGMYQSTMAGGVANIWGNLTGDFNINTGTQASVSYNNRAQIKAYSTFFENRFLRGMIVCNELSDNVGAAPNLMDKSYGNYPDRNGRCLRSGANQYVFYREDSNTLTIDLKNATTNLPVIAMDTISTQTYNLSALEKGKRHNVTLPKNSDWVVAVGNFGSSGGTTPPPPQPPAPPPPPPPPPTQSSTPISTPPSTKSADANNDGVVNSQDLSIWKNNYGKSLSGRSNGDFNNDSRVDGIDYVIWVQQS